MELTPSRPQLHREREKDQPSTAAISFGTPGGSPDGVMSPVVTSTAWSFLAAGSVRRLGAHDHQIIDDCIGRGLDGCQDRLLSALSGGRRQRALLAQGLAQRADIVLLVEPTSGLDAVTREVVADVLLTERARGATMICVTHDDVAVGDLSWSGVDRAHQVVK